jgi:hypothetical protein
MKDSLAGCLGSNLGHASAGEPIHIATETTTDIPANLRRGLSYVRENSLARKNKKERAG